MPQSEPSKPTDSSHATRGDWTLGPAKWIAVGVLGGASAVGLMWAVIDRTPGPLAVSPAAGAPASQPILLADPQQPNAPAATPGNTAAPSGSPPTPSPASMPSVPQPAQTSTAAVEPATPPATPVSPPATAAVSGGKINVNSATAEQLETLPGIGPVLAKSIIEDRQRRGPFRSLADLDRVKGIGPKTLENLRPHVTIE